MITYDEQLKLCYLRQRTDEVCDGLVSLVIQYPLIVEEVISRRRPVVQLLIFTELSEAFCKLGNYNA